MPLIGKYKRGMLIKSENTDVTYVIVSQQSTKSDCFTVLPLQNLAAKSLGLHGDCLYILTSKDLARDYLVLGEFDLDILRPKYVFNEEKKELTVEERLDKIEEQIEKLSRRVERNEDRAAYQFFGSYSDDDDRK